jgi:diguanylate cyclase (GGDEF)-like protein/PAS domain S-box-containing protein
LALLRCISLILASVLLLTFGAVGVADDEREPLIVSQDHAWPPFSWRNSAGEPEGLLIDLWLELGEQMGRPVEFELVDWPETITQVAEGRAHVHGGLFRSSEREELLEFSTELMPLSTFVFVEAGLPIMGTEGLAEVEVGVIASSMELEHMLNHLPDVPLRLYDNNEQMVRAALAGDVMAFVADYPVGMYLLDMHREPSAFRPLTRLYQSSLHAAVRVGDRQLLEEVNAALATVDEDQLRRLLQRWMRSEPVEVLPPWLLPAIVSGALVLVLLVYAAFLLQRRRALEHEVAERTRQLGEQERLFRTLFENAGAGIFLLQGDRFTAVNSALVELSGYSREALLSQELSNLVHSDDRDLVIGRARARQRGENVPAQYQYRIVRADGEVRWVELTAGMLFMETGPVTVGTLYDLTDHYRLQQQLRASENKFRMLVENATDIMYRLSKDGTVEYVSPNWRHLLGHPVEEVEGAHFSKFVHEDDVDTTARFIEQVVASGERVESIEFRMRQHNGDHRWYSSNAAPLINDEGQVDGVSGIGRDISESRAAEVERRRQHEFRRLIAEISTDILNAPINRIDEVMEQMLERLGRYFDVDRAYIYRVSEDGDFIYLVHEWCSSGTEPTTKEQAVLSKNDFRWWFKQAMGHMRGNEPFYIADVTKLPPEADKERALFDAQKISTLVTMQLQVGESMIGFFGFDSCRPRTWRQEINALLVVLANLLSDVFEKMRLEQELTRSSVTDPLTGLYNRRHLLAKLNQAIEQRVKVGDPFAVAILDIDHFKQLNDTFGHLAGDAVLEELARLVSQTSRGDDVVGRYGGEEFMIVLNGVDGESAAAVLERVLATIRGHGFPIGGEQHHITGSCGLVAAEEFEDDELNSDRLIGRADQRLYLAKQAGRDRLVWQGD